ncbi:hypothetical protein SDC9_108746 [bioreactor metagenome]|uniref:Uncharacterized protein n=1 Tax=bioreactor metagenome TaxID=1076179 RepID=A0A645BFD1_9ZZZZ
MAKYARLLPIDRHKGAGYNDQKGCERESRPKKTRLESGAHGGSDAGGLWRNGTREPRDRTAEPSAVSRDAFRRYRATSGTNTSKRLFKQGGTAGFPSLVERNLLFLYTNGCRMQYNVVRSCSISVSNSVLNAVEGTAQVFIVEDRSCRTTEPRRVPRTFCRSRATSGSIWKR